MSSKLWVIGGIRRWGDRWWRHIKWRLDHETLPVHRLPQDVKHQSDCHVECFTSRCLLAFSTVVRCGGSVKKRDAMQLNRLVKRACSGVATGLVSLLSMVERRTITKLLSITDIPHHPLHSTFTGQRNMSCGRFLSQSCSTDKIDEVFCPLGHTAYTAM